MSANPECISAAKMKGKKPEECEFNTTNKTNRFDKLREFPGKLN